MGTENPDQKTVYHELAPPPPDEEVEVEGKGAPPPQTTTTSVAERSRPITRDAALGEAPNSVGEENRRTGGTAHPGEPVFGGQGKHTRFGEAVGALSLSSISSIA